jgi:hypothetical protein
MSGSYAGSTTSSIRSPSPSLNGSHTRPASSYHLTLPVLYDYLSASSPPRHLVGYDERGRTSDNSALPTDTGYYHHPPPVVLMQADSRAVPSAGWYRPPDNVSADGIMSYTGSSDLRFLPEDELRPSQLLEWVSAQYGLHPSCAFLPQ